MNHTKHLSLCTIKLTKDVHGAPADDDNKIEIITGAPYTDIKMTAFIRYSEPKNLDVFDSSTTNTGDFISDEMGVFTNATDFNNPEMLTHVIFTTVQKSQNRVIEIIYTIRVQLS